MKANGMDVLSFSAGEPDFNTPEPIRNAAIQAINSGFTKYVATPGIKDLREAIVEKFAVENQLDYKVEEIMVSSGAKQALYNAFMALLNPGDEVILLAPYWMTYADQIRLAGGVPVVVHTTTASGFIPTMEAVQEALTPRTRAIVVNSPSNPTGCVLDTNLLREIAEFAHRNNLWIVTDEIYEHLVYGTTHTSLATFSPEIKARTLTINGCSKSYSMTGWRIGYVAAPAPLIKAMTNIQDQVTSGANSFAQKGAVAALKLPHSEVETMRVEFEARRDLVVKLLRQIPGLVVPEPKGAFYSFFNVDAYLGGQYADDVALSQALLEEALVAVVPGSVFEGPGHLRLSYATNQETIAKGVERIADFLSQIQK